MRKILLAAGAAALIGLPAAALAQTATTNNPTPATGRGTLDANGNLTITLLVADTAILREGDLKENRSLTIDFTYPGGVGRHRVKFTVVAMPGQ